jgi:hypothetical protein
LSVLTIDALETIVWAQGLAAPSIGSPDLQEADRRSTSGLRLSIRRISIEIALWGAPRI